MNEARPLIVYDLEAIEHFPDPLARIVARRLIREGKAVLRQKESETVAK